MKLNSDVLEFDANFWPSVSVSRAVSDQLPLIKCWIFGGGLVKWQVQPLETAGNTGMAQLSFVCIAYNMGV